jgi:ribosomal protein L29
MNAQDLARIEYHRRHSRPDWRRFVRPDWEYRVNPAGRAAIRKDMALRDRAFETPMARRWREEKEQREREEQERLDAEQREQIEHEALELKAELAELRFELTMRRMAWEAKCAAHKRWADAAWKRVMAAFMRGDFARQKRTSTRTNRAYRRAIRTAGNGAVMERKGREKLRTFNRHRNQIGRGSRNTASAC